MPRATSALSIDSNTTWTTAFDATTSDGPAAQFVTIQNNSTSDQSLEVRSNVWIDRDGNRESITLAAGSSVTIGSPGANAGYVTTVEARAAASPSSTTATVVVEATLA
jgi:hypothetical protein